MIFSLEAQVLRMMVTNTESTLKERTGLIDSKFISMVQGHFPDNYLSDCIEFVLQDISLQKEGSGKQRANFKQVFLTYTGKDIIQEDTEGNKFFSILITNLNSFYCFYLFLSHKWILVI